jgi:hypothetical protein
MAGVETVTSTVTTHEGGKVVSHSRHASVASILSERAAVSISCLSFAPSRRTHHSCLM